MTPFEDREDDRPGEPEEFDPDEVGPEIPDVEPSVEVPSVDVSDAAASLDEDLFRAFWGAVVFLNVALVALSLGVMLVYFRGDWERGGASVAVGVVAAAFVGRYYLLSLSARDGDAEGDGEGPDGGDGTEATAAPGEDA